MNLRLWIFFEHCFSYILSAVIGTVVISLLCILKFVFISTLTPELRHFPPGGREFYFLILFTILILLLCYQKMFALLFIHLEKTVVSLVVQDMIMVGVHEYWKNTFYIFMEENLIYIYIIISVFCIPIFFTSSNRRLEEVNYYCISIFLWLSYIFIYWCYGV